MNKVFLFSLIVALAGFLFGFDMVVISGADQELQLLWNSSDTFHGFVVMAMALWGTVAGALLGGKPVKKYGRKNSLIIIGLMYLISALGSALSVDPYWFSFFRFLGGLGVGASTIAAPAYIAEISPANQRGKLVAMYQLSIVLGVLGAMLSNYFLKDMGQNAWRWMLGTEAIPAFIYTILVFGIPRSPRWLIYKGRVEEAHHLIRKYSLEISTANWDDPLSKKKKHKAGSIFQVQYRALLYLIFFIAFFNQFSGINAILYYAPRIFEEAGLAREDAFLGGVWIGLVNLLFTLLGMYLIDLAGRKKLMYLGSIGYIISLFIVSYSFYNGTEGSGILFFLLLFIASHAIGQGTVIWVFISELYPTHLRSEGQAFGSSVHWLLAAILPASIPYLFSEVGAALVFGVFGLFMIFQLIWVYFYMPETKGKSLESLSEELSTS